MPKEENFADFEILPEAMEKEGGRISE